MGRGLHDEALGFLSGLRFRYGKIYRSNIFFIHIWQNICYSKEFIVQILTSPMILIMYLNYYMIMLNNLWNKWVSDHKGHCQIKVLWPTPWFSDLENQQHLKHSNAWENVNSIKFFITIISPSRHVSGQDLPLRTSNCQALPTEDSKGHKGQTYTLSDVQAPPYRVKSPDQATKPHKS